ncbi:hypothetical protein HPB50_020988 [Hyalomma asiaticum]|uniref:Uncharacterized protein n=1 Tax=Hyalomma asiaticum TaxID=266040 RepID=A0ACB7T642_HYAAI|nr:hypothetical protein HPB50_020988 [Hyalomma asiaticum]
MPPPRHRRAASGPPVPSLEKHGGERESRCRAGMPNPSRTRGNLGEHPHRTGNRHRFFSPPFYPPAPKQPHPSLARRLLAAAELSVNALGVSCRDGTPRRTSGRGRHRLPAAVR